jgi:hypothetical protein
MVGGMVLARGVSDEALSDEILEAVRAHIADMDKAFASWSKMANNSQPVALADP